MTQKDTGGPAFPLAYLGHGHLAGMTLRDYFAGGASEEDIKIHQVWKISDCSGHFVKKSATYTREQARYRYADAMIAARKETT